MWSCGCMNGTAPGCGRHALDEVQSAAVETVVLKEKGEERERERESLRGYNARERTRDLASLNKQFIFQKLDKQPLQKVSRTSPLL